MHTYMHTNVHTGDREVQGKLAMLNPVKDFKMHSLDFVDALAKRDKHLSNMRER